MTPKEMVAHCKMQQTLAGEDAEVSFIVNKPWRNQKRIRMGHPRQGGPWGTPVASQKNGTIVFFRAKEVVAWIEKAGSC